MRRKERGQIEKAARVCGWGKHRESQGTQEEATFLCFSYLSKTGSIPPPSPSRNESWEHTAISIQIARVTEAVLKEEEEGCIRRGDGEVLDCEGKVETVGKGGAFMGRQEWDMGVVSECMCVRWGGSSLQNWNDEARVSSGGSGNGRVGSISLIHLTGDSDSDGVCMVLGV